MFKLYSITASAEVNPELHQFIAEQINATQAALSNVDSTENEEFELRRFLLRLQAKFGIKIPIFAKFEVIPEIEIVMQKEKLNE